MSLTSSIGAASAKHSRANARLGVYPQWSEKGVSEYYMELAHCSVQNALEGHDMFLIRLTKNRHRSNSLFLTDLAEIRNIVANLSDTITKVSQEIHDQFGDSLGWSTQNGVKLQLEQNAEKTVHYYS